MLYPFHSYAVHSIVLTLLFFASGATPAPTPAATDSLGNTVVCNCPLLPLITHQLCLSVPFAAFVVCLSTICGCPLLAYDHSCSIPFWCFSLHCSAPMICPRVPRETALDLALTVPLMFFLVPFVAYHPILTGVYKSQLLSLISWIKRVFTSPGVNCLLVQWLYFGHCLWYKVDWFQHHV